MPTKKKETEGDIVMHVHERMAQVTVKRTVKLGENYESRELMRQIATNGSAGEAYESIVETMRGLTELLDDEFGDLVFEDDQSRAEIVKETFDAEELVIEEPEENGVEITSGNIMHLFWDVWHDCTKKNVSITLGKKKFPSGGGDYDEDFNGTIWGYLREEYGSAKIKQEWSDAQRKVLWTELNDKAEEVLGKRYQPR